MQIIIVNFCGSNFYLSLMYNVLGTFNNTFQTMSEIKIALHCSDIKLVSCEVICLFYLHLMNSVLNT